MAGAGGRAGEISTGHADLRIEAGRPARCALRVQRCSTNHEDAGVAFAGLAHHQPFDGYSFDMRVLPLAVTAADDVVCLFAAKRD
jgi:hypothetical protein